MAISAAMFFLALGIAGKWTLITAVAPQSYCTSVASIQNFGGYIGGTVSPLATGMVVDLTGSFVIALAIGAGVTILGAVILQTVVRTPISSAMLDADVSFVPGGKGSMNGSTPATELLRRSPEALLWPCGRTTRIPRRQASVPRAR